MNKLIRRFFQTIVILIGLITWAFLLFEPHFEGRNVGATLFQIYFNDPILVYAYLSSIPFFIILYQTYKILGSKITVKALRIIRRCTLLNILLVLIGEIWIIFTVSDDRAGGFFMGFLIIMLSLVINFLALKIEKIKTLKLF
jgi:hypothetical protein